LKKLKKGKQVQRHAVPPVASEAHQGVATHQALLSCIVDWLHVLLCVTTSSPCSYVVCWCTCTKHSHCVSTSLSASMCTAPHAEPPFHASVPLAPTDSLLVCVVDEVEKKRKKRKMLQEPEQQEAAVGIPLLSPSQQVQLEGLHLVSRLTFSIA